jgi:uncharacterized protein (DUF342 family)
MTTPDLFLSTTIVLFAVSLFLLKKVYDYKAEIEALKADLNKATEKQIRFIDLYITGLAEKKKSIRKHELTEEANIILQSELKKTKAKLFSLQGNFTQLQKRYNDTKRTN